MAVLKWHARVIFEVSKIEALEEYHLTIFSWLSYFIYVYIRYCL